MQQQYMGGCAGKTYEMTLASCCDSMKAIATTMVTTLQNEDTDNDNQNDREFVQLIMARGCVT